MNQDRKLATIEVIVEISSIPDADNIERARIRGWDVVVRKGEFQVGDAVVYFEVDSLLDVLVPQFAFLESRGVRTDSEGRRGHVLKTARLRGQYSQGLAVALGDFPDLNDGEPGDDVTDALGVIKWEPPVPANLAGEVRGMRPSWIPKTDEERIQNIEILLDLGHFGGLPWTATEKIDGSSTSFGLDVETREFHVCSRNLDILEREGNTLWRLARELDIEGLLNYEVSLVPAECNYAVLQGESFGEGIQGNPLKIKGQRFAAYNLIVGGLTVPRAQWPHWVKEMSVPEVDLPYPVSVDEALAQVETLKSAISPDRPAEGVVWRGPEPYVTLADGRSFRASWKAVSTRYLLKNDR